MSYWNTDMVGVPTAWARGYRGQGAVVGIVDSGVDYTHPALQDKFRGYRPSNPSTPDINYNWRDFVEPTRNAEAPHDEEFGHGTGVVGVAVGQASGYNIGVAPNAKWIACRIFTAPSILSCLDWMRNPTNVNGTPAPAPTRMAPNIVNISLGIEGGYSSNYWQVSINNLLASDILPVVANEEETPAIGFPEAYRSSYGVGAVAYGTLAPASSPTAAYDVATYSARGSAPTPYTNLVKPEIVAPGGSADGTVSHDICTSQPDDGYLCLYGTSYAAPHVAGAAAILLSRAGMTPGQMMYWLDHGTLEGIGHQPSADEEGRGFGLLRVDKSLDLYNKFITNTCPNTNFSDVPPNNLFYGHIKFLACGGVVSGYGDGTFKPSDLVSRAQFAKFVSVGFGLSYYNPPASTFTDVNVNNVLRQYIESAARVGIAQGSACTNAQGTPTSGTCFRPNDPIRRGEVAIMVQRARQYLPNFGCSFSDVSCQPFDWARPSIEALYVRGVVWGESCPGATPVPTPTQEWGSWGGGNESVEESSIDDPEVVRCFRPNDYMRRGELSRMFANAIVRVGPYGGSNR